MNFVIPNEIEYLNKCMSIAKSTIRTLARGQFYIIIIIKYAAYQQVHGLMEDMYFFLMSDS